MYVLGYEDTKAVIELGEGVATKLYVDHANAVRMDGFQGSLLDYHNQYRTSVGLAPQP